MKKWYKLDNAASLFPSVTNTKNSSVFRLSAVLMEHVDPYILHKAIDLIYDRFPILTLKMRKGVFWNYFDENAVRLIPQPEQDYPCKRIRPSDNDGHLIKVLYHGNRISVEVFHSLTDGAGALDFLKSLVFYYLKLKGKDVELEDKIIACDSPVNPSEVEDSFLTLLDKDRYKELKKKCKTQNQDRSRSAYRLKAEPFSVYGNRVVQLEMDANALHAASKAKGGTITTYLAAKLLEAIYTTTIRVDKSKKPVMLTVPVNLRRYFPSNSSRNFFAAINIGTNMYPKLEEEELIQTLSTQLKAATEKDNLFMRICSNVILEKSTRLVPLFLKLLFIPVGFNSIGEDKKTLTLSNLGICDLPKSVEPHIDRMEFVLYPSKKSPINMTVVTAGKKAVLSFVLSKDFSELVRQFTIALSRDVSVKVNSNEWCQGDFK